jgi:S1-C subfamily serine protease
MPHHLRRILGATAIIVAAALIYQVWRQQQPGYGLFDLLRGKAADLALVGAPRLSEKDVPSLAKFSEDSMKLAAAVLPSVVSINTDTVNPIAFRDFFGGLNLQYRLAMSLGSGVIIEGGYVVTNNHVIRNAAQINIITNDGVKHDAEFIGANEEVDIAVLRIVGGGELPALQFANSDDVKPGQVVFAVGNPFGLSGTVTQGIISATKRQLTDDGRPFLQTDTVINPGNSGGPLVDIRGQVVGINEALYAGPGNGQPQTHQQTWAGVGLTIPSNEARAAVEAIVKSVSAKGKAHGYFGVEFDKRTVRVSQRSDAVGARVVKVNPGSPAEKMGLHEGDFIIGFSGKQFRSLDELKQLIRDSRPGLVEQVDIFRNGSTYNLVVTMGREP